MVWDDVTEIGVGIACGNETLSQYPQYPGKSCYVVANYKSTPNIVGQYLQHVQPLISQ